jgi:DNA mismatch repair protein MSH2
MSLYGLLNKGRTPMGHRLLTQWIKQPLRDIAAIERRLNYVDIFVEQTELRQAMLEEHFKAVPDLDRLAKKFQKSKANLQNIVQLYQFVVRLPAILDTLRSYNGAHQSMIENEMCSKLERIIGDLKNFEAMVEQTIDLEALDRHEFIVNPAFDDRVTLTYTGHTLVRLMVHVYAIYDI